MEVAERNIYELWTKEQCEDANHIGNKILFCHFGEFSEDFIFRISDFFEQEVIKLKHDYKLARRLISSLNEVILNINKYSHTTKTKTGHLQVSFDGDKFLVEASNVINKKDEMILQSRIDDINTLSKSELWARYYELKKRSLINNSDGLGIGMLTIRINSSSIISCKSYKLSENTLIMYLNYQV